MRIEPEPGAGFRKPRPVALTAMEILRRMVEGWSLSVGSGVYSYVCCIVRGQERLPVWRQRLGALRDAGYIEWCVGSAIVTARGRAALGLPTAVAVQTRAGLRPDRAASDRRARSAGKQPA